MAVLVYLVLFLALTGHSTASYCFCKDGLSDQALQKALDYACGAGADCSPISQSGSCYQPNTVKNHCDYAVNSYYQRKNQAQGSCDFAGTASVSQTAPTVASASCVYPASPGQAGTSTSTNTSTTPPSTTTPTTGTPTTGTPTTGTPTTTSFIPPPPGFIAGISPTGTTSTTGINDGSAGVALSRGTGMFFSLALTLCSLLLWG
ncbi:PLASMODESMATA CALLOSE-BINDING PROTEIN 3-like [Corylus avellana]|uniref:PLASMODESMATA CALLOSE-BINDING PROTEIN 3-like n=1 Tax=Corylus avellana TaxID=13451 RepID=UPI001E20CEB8|nr:PLASMODESMATA CALLOSE-BINDING PROTEIN 3-like [Corylus avellana]